MPLRNWLRSLSSKNSSRLTRSKTIRLQVESLEDRCVPTVGLASALGLGNATGPSAALDIAADAAGNSYLTGYFSGATDFDPAHVRADNSDILTARGSRDAFVVKYAADNSLVWARRMGGDDAGFDTGRQIQLDNSGNIYVVGEFYGTADFGTVTRTSAGSSDGFVAKLNSSGTIQWANRWGVALADQGHGVGVDAAGNVYAMGTRNGGSAATNGNDVLKFSPTGTAVWADWVNTRMSISSDMAVDAAGNTFVCGMYAGTVDFNPGDKTKYVTGGQGGYDGFVLKLNAAGNFGWVSAFNGQQVGAGWGASAAQSLALDGGGNIIVGGYYLGSVDFNPGAGTTILSAAHGDFLTKLDGSGNLIWAKSLEGDSTAFMWGMTVDTAGNIYATGSFNGTVDFDPGAGTQTRTSAGGSDIFVMKLNAAGNFVWAETFGSTGDDIGWSVAVDTAGTVYLAGGFRGTVDFDSDPLAVQELANSGTFYNIYFVKLQQS